MTAISLDAAGVDGFSLRHGLSWRDPDIDCTLVISQPARTAAIASMVSSVLSTSTRCAAEPIPSCTWR